MDVENNAIVSKTRCPALTGQVIERTGSGLAETLTTQLEGNLDAFNKELGLEQ